MQIDKTVTETGAPAGAPVGRGLPDIFRGLFNAQFARALLLPLGSVLISMVLIAIPLLAININPLTIFQTIVEGALGSRYALGQTFQRSVPLIFTALAFAFAWKSGLFNVGAHGQLVWGGLGAVWVALVWGPMPPVLHILLALVIGVIAGGLWGLVPGAMKAYLGVSEVISTIMLNFVADYMALIIFGGPLLDKKAPFPTTAFISQSLFLPFLFQGTRLHVGFIIAIACAFIVQFFLVRTTRGLQIRAVGSNQSASRHAGIPVRSNQILAMVISGALAGLGGAIEVLGVQHRVGYGWTGTWGFQGIAVALLAQTYPLGIPIAAAFFGLLEAGSNHMQAVTGVPGSIIFLVQGLPVLFMMVVSSRRFFGRKL